MSVAWMSVADVAGVDVGGVDVAAILGRPEPITAEPRLIASRAVPRPAVSVLVAVYDVGAYLAPCLDSLAAQTLTDLEILVIDDGSTDGSAALLDEWVSRHEHCRVVHVANGGLGSARNLGLAGARGDYVAFVDGDDMVPARAYEVMLAAARAGGADVVTGRVERFDGSRVWPSRLQQLAWPAPETGTTLRRSPSLLYDYVAWNKLYRREFWESHALRFPEGILYEDIPVTIPALFHARRIDTLDETVYRWRRRDDGTRSITDRMTDLRNLADRFSSVRSAWEFLRESGEPALSDAYGGNVLRHDARLFLDVLPLADAEFRTRYLDLVGAFLTDVGPRVRAGLAPYDRARYALVRRRRLAALLALLTAERTARALARPGRRLVRRVRQR